MVRTCPSSMHSTVAVRRLLGVRKPSSPMRRPGRSSTPISLTRNFPVTVRNISVAASSFLNSLSPLAIFAFGHEWFEPFHRHVTLRRVACLLNELEQLTEANGIDRQQQQIKQKGGDASGKRAKDCKECTADHIRDPKRHHSLHQQGSDKEDGSNQGEHVGERDVG